MPSYYRDPTAPEPNKPRKIGAVALIVRDGTLLLDCRADDGAWGLVGGALEENESVRAAVIREVYEETGLVVRESELMGVFSDPTRIVEYEDGSVFRLLTVAFEVRVAEGAPIPSDESRELRFVAFDELLEFNVFPAHRPIIEVFLQRPQAVIVA